MDERVQGCPNWWQQATLDQIEFDLPDIFIEIKSIYIK